MSRSRATANIVRFCTVAALESRFANSAFPAPRCTALSFSPDGKTLALSDRDSITLWDAVVLELRETLRFGRSRHALPSLAFALNGLNASRPRRPIRDRLLVGVRVLRTAVIRNRQFRGSGRRHGFVFL